MKNLILSLTIFLPIILLAQLHFPETEVVKLTPNALFNYPQINESSAIVKSRMWNDVFWTLNDSGAKNRIFPINSRGDLYRPAWYDSTQGGVYIGDAVNIDWEDMAVDNHGNLYIAACGNNENMRRDLAIYILKDPNPNVTSLTRISQRIDFYFPEQTRFPADPNNFDCEALFWAKDKLYLLTKHRADTQTHLYRFDAMDPLKDNPVTRIATFDIQGMVTAADASLDGEKLAVLTYNAIWLFESDNDNYFQGKISWLPIKAKQCEGICFDEETLVITNEQMEIFRIKLEELIRINK